MTRNLRHRSQPPADAPAGDDNPAEITDENGVTHTTTRSLRRVNYAEMDNIFADDEEVPAHEETPEPEPEETAPPRSLRKRPQHHNDDDSDQSFQEDDSDDMDDDIEDDIDIEDEYTDAYGGDEKKRAARDRARRDRNFVVPDPDDEEAMDDDDDDDEDVYYGNSRRRTRNRNRKSKKARVERHRTPPRRNLRSTSVRQNDTDDDNDNDGSRPVTLADEIRELEEDSPLQEKRSLRERTKPVDYTIPPPLTAATAEQYLKSSQAGSFANPSPARRGGGRGWNTGGPIRRLFPTGGPFGGNDAATIFGQNTNFYGNTNLGNPLNRNNANANNKLILDSDSSDDEILPLGATPKQKDNNNPLKKKKKKKPEIADIDPLGVDMNISFDEVGGLDNYIDQLKEMVTLPLLYPELYQNFNIMPPRGVLFHGPPGTGKTLMARALAASCSSESRKITFFMRKGADILSKWVGEAERQLRLLFEEAKKQQPSIIFFDEIDGLAPVRSSKQEQIHASIVSTMLALMDGMDNRGQVIVIGATNRPDAVDPALRRPGRFDREFYFPLPDEKARATILKIQTKKWTPQLPETLVNGLAKLTKGYGGADLRALCTEAALSSIQRKYPQIYRSNDKLMVDPAKLKVNHKDFMLALKKIVPSSARQTGSSAEPLPPSVQPLLENQFKRIKSSLDEMLADNKNNPTSSSTIIQHYIDYEDSESEDETGTAAFGGFDKYDVLNRIKEAQICNPRLLIAGPQGNGQQYIGAAILNKLEHYNVQKLDLGTLVSDGTRSIESAIVQGFVEARKRQPSIVFIPNIEMWSKSIPISAISTLASLFRSLKSNERVLLLGIADSPVDELNFDETFSQLPFHEGIFNLEKPQASDRANFFSSIVTTLQMKPTAFNTEKKRTKPLEKLPLVPLNTLPENTDENGNPLSDDEILMKKLKKFQYQDMKLKNVLKIKLSGLMDLFKNRYKRFRKPTIDDAFLVHLFEPSPDPNWQPAYIKEGDMILEVATGRKFYNMDLDIVEERLWNGYYSEPKQFLEDIELIYLDAMTVGDRERVIKASEMFANAQMGIEDISTPELIKECKITRKRDHEREELYKRQLQKEQLQNNVVTTDATTNGAELDGSIPPAVEAPVANPDINIGAEVGVGAGNQLQAQLQLDSSAITGNMETPQIDSGVDVTQPVEIPVANESSQQDVALEHMGTQEITEPQSLVEPKVDNTENGIIEPAVSTDADATVDKTNDAASGETKAEVTEPSTSQQLETKPRPIDNRVVTIDNNMVDNILNQLIEKTDDFTVSALELVYARLIKIAWQNRQEWDKTETLSRIQSYVEKLHT